MGLPWLCEVNPQIDWKEGVLDIEAAQQPQKIDANRKSRHTWVRAGLIEERDELWLCAGYTFLQRITEKQNSEKEMKILKEMIPAKYRHYMKVFLEEESHRLPEHKPWDHTIELKEGAPEAIHARVFPMSQLEDEKLGRFLDDTLTKGYIVPSKSLMVSPVFFVKKKDRKLRFIQDYRKLNAVTIKNHYLLLLASDIINHLTKAKIFTKFDVRWGYNNIRIKEADQWKAVFITNRGSFEPYVMYFGLTNSPATFQTLMNMIFTDLIAGGKVAVYMDDILIYSTNTETYQEMTHKVLRCLKEYDLYLKSEKCEFDCDPWHDHRTWSHKHGPW